LDSNRRTISLQLIMPQIEYRANLSAAVYPMQISDAGRTVIVPGPDNHFDRRVDPAGEQKNAGIPQALYLQDVIPTVDGYQSVGYKTLPAASVAGSGSAFFAGDINFVDSFGQSNKLFVVFREGGGGFLDSWATTPSSAGLSWTATTGDDPQNPSGLSKNISLANVRGTTYLFDGSVLYTLVNSSAAAVAITNINGSLTGIVAADIAAICSANNYLVAVLEDGTIQWSSTTTPTDFTASLVSGAGSQVPNNLVGTPKFLAQTSYGFNIYTTQTVIAAQYTGNARYPWKFTPIKDAGGYFFPSQIHSDPNSPINYAIDSAGNIKIIQLSGATIVAPELSTYLERRTSKDVFTYTTNVFSLEAVVSSFQIHSLVLILDRYILIKDSVTNNTYWYDLTLQRYGKLIVSGVPTTTINGLERGHIFFISDVEVENKVLTTDIYDTTYTFQGVIALGKFQYVRSRVLQLEGVEVEGLQDTALIPSPNFSCVLLPSADGRNFDAPQVQTSIYNSGGLIKYTPHVTGLNHTILFKGAFQLSSLQLTFVPGGDR
jgi:hypothetical protein